VKSLKEFKDIDIEQLIANLDKQCNAVEEKIIQAFAGNLPVFEFERN